MKTEYCICVDGGTTNTRATVWSAPKIDLSESCSTAIFSKVSTAKRNVGVRNTSIDGNNNALKEAVCQCLCGAMEQAGLSWDDVGCILAAGMITSNLGIYELPHLTAPVDLADFAAGMHTEDMPDIAPLPIHFIPGVRNLPVPVDPAQLDQMDIMRGEEVETVALLGQLPDNTGSVLLLPGSHTKFVFVDGQKRITACITTLSGEMLDLLTKESILADTVGSRFAEEATCDMTYVQRGFTVAEKYGIARAVFSCRIEGLFSDATKDQMASFLMGAVLQQDILALYSKIREEALENPRIFVAGKQPFRKVLAFLLKQGGLISHVEELAEREDLSAKGCLAVAKQKGLVAQSAG